MSLIITSAGILETFQDTGRVGCGGWGINPSGAMDRFALFAANVLVGNPLGEAAIEMHYPGPTIYFSAPALISLTGGDFSPRINNNPVANWKTILVPEDSTLTFASKNFGFRSYLSVHGGFNIPRWLDSKSVNLKAHVGGINGRPLRKHDTIALNSVLRNSTFQTFSWTINHRNTYQPASTINFLPSAIWNSFDKDTQNNILSTPMRILPTSDRMGFYLDNEPILLLQREELLSSAVAFGTIQILPSGKLVCLMADHQTTGGYPRLGSVITSDLPKLAQLNPGSPFYLSPVSLEEAENRLFSQQQNIRLASLAINEKLKSILQ